jgi:hypothetical protein
MPDEGQADEGKADEGKSGKSGSGSGVYVPLGMYHKKKQKEYSRLYSFTLQT